VGVKEKFPEVGSKAMFEARPDAESTTGPPVPLGSFAETVNWIFLPTVAFCAPGTAITGRTWAEITVITT
jgi:hypothetical protein